MVIPRVPIPLDDPSVGKVIFHFNQVYSAHLALHNGQLKHIDVLKRKLAMCKEEVKVYFLQYPPLGGAAAPDVDRVYVDFLEMVTPKPPAAAPQPQQQEAVVSGSSPSPTPDAKSTSVSTSAPVVPKVPVVPKISLSAVKKDRWADAVDDSEPESVDPPPRPLVSPKAPFPMPPPPPVQIISDPSKVVARDASAGIPPTKAATTPPVGSASESVPKAPEAPVFRFGSRPSVDDTRVAPTAAEQAAERANSRALYLAECSMRWNNWTNLCHQAYLRATWVNNKLVFTPPVAPPKYTPDGQDIDPALAQALMEFPPAHFGQSVPRAAFERASELRLAAQFLGHPPDVTPVQAGFTPAFPPAGAAPPPPPGPPPAWVRDLQKGIGGLPSEYTGAPGGTVPPGSEAAPVPQPNVVFTGPAPVVRTDGSTQTTPDLLMDVDGNRVQDPVLYAMHLMSQVVSLQKDLSSKAIDLERSQQRVSQLELEAQEHESLQDELDDLRGRLAKAESLQAEVMLKDQLVRQLRDSCDRLEQDLFASRAACKSAEDELETLRLGAEGVNLSSPFATSAREFPPERLSSGGESNLPLAPTTTPVGDPPSATLVSPVAAPDVAGPPPTLVASFGDGIRPEVYKMNSSESSSSRSSEASSDWDEAEIARRHVELLATDSHPTAAFTAAVETGPVSSRTGDAADQARLSLGGLD